MTLRERLAASGQDHLLDKPDVATGIDFDVPSCNEV